MLFSLFFPLPESIVNTFLSMLLAKPVFVFIFLYC